MGTFSIMHWLVVLAVVLLLFGGRGKISAIMGDFGKGLRSFKTGLKGDENEGDAAEDELARVGDDLRPERLAARSTAKLPPETLLRC